MKLAPLFVPSERKNGPTPARVDLRSVFWVGELIWCVALVVLIFSREYFADRMWLVCMYTCVIGLILGVFLIIWEFF